MLIYEYLFNDSKLLGINWTEAKYSQYKISCNLEFYNSILNLSNFFGLFLKKSIIKKCVCKEVDFILSNLESSIFESSDFPGSIFENTNLTNVDFRNAKNYNISTYTNKIHGSKFSFPEVISLFKDLNIEIY